jgi:phosphoglucosamine mutase
MTGRVLFGTDGVRGEANIAPMTADIALKLGQAAAVVLRQEGHRNRFLVGKDTRLSCYVFENAIAAGIASMGADVMLVGPLSTPGIAFMTQSMRADAGVVISASHNPYQDNGIKLFDRQGYKLCDEMESRIEDLVIHNKLDAYLPSSAELGRAFKYEDSRGRYVVFLKNTFPKDLTLEGMRIVVDCANGAAYKVAPMVLEELGARVFALGVDPDGFNINDACGAMFPEHMREAVDRYRADIGISLDGDADRVVISDEKGNVVDGDHIMAICARDLARREELSGDTVVATVMSNVGLEISLREAGLKLARTAVGDRYVVEEMRRGGYTLGGEQSGHIIFRNHSTTGDGMIAALSLLSIMVREQKPLSKLAGVMETLPQATVSVRVARKPPIESLESVSACIQAATEKLRGEGRILVRYSGTEPKARVMVEGPEIDLVRDIADSIGRSLVREIGAE